LSTKILARSPQYGYSLTQLAYLGFRFAKYVLFWLNWGYLKRLSKIFWELGNQQEDFNVDNPWHNWLVWRSESPNIFCFDFFGIIRLWDTLKDFQKYFNSREISRKSLILTLPDVSGSLGVQSLQTFLFYLVWVYKTLRDFKRLFKIF
jgi:hypothetical protein